MLNNEALKHHLMAVSGIIRVDVQGDGYHYEITVVSDVFSGQSKVARQRWVYAQLKSFITSGELHAINMNTWTSEEWEKQHG